MSVAQRLWSAGRLAPPGSAWWRHQLPVDQSRGEQSALGAGPDRQRDSTCTEASLFLSEAWLLFLKNSFIFLEASVFAILLDLPLSTSDVLLLRTPFP